MANWLPGNYGSKLRKANWLFEQVAGDDAGARQAEHELGAELAESLAADFPPDEDKNARQFVCDMGKYLASRRENTDQPFAFCPVISPEINAFALPGGHIFITRRLCELCKWDQNELAFVLAHEMAHVTLGHAKRRMMDGAIFSSVMGATPMGGVVEKMLGGLTKKFISRGYDLPKELEADRQALGLLGRANFDPQGAVRFLQRLAHGAARAAQRGETIAYARSHPPLDRRRQNIESVFGGK